MRGAAGEPEPRLAPLAPDRLDTSQRPLYDAVLASPRGHDAPVQPGDGGARAARDPEPWATRAFAAIGWPVGGGHVEPLTRGGGASA